MLYGLIVTPADLEAAKAEMNSAHSTVTGLAAQASAKVSPQLASRISSFSEEVKTINDSSSVWSLGPTLIEYTQRAKAATSTAAQLANELAVLLNIQSPIVAPRSTMSILLSLAVAGVAGYWIYKWATASGPEPYPRHLVPRYAGGHRRGGF